MIDTGCLGAMSAGTCSATTDRRSRRCGKIGIEIGAASAPRDRPPNGQTGRFGTSTVGQAGGAKVPLAGNAPTSTVSRGRRLPARETGRGHPLCSQSYTGPAAPMSRRPRLARQGGLDPTRWRLTGANCRRLGETFNTLWPPLFTRSAPSGIVSHLYARTHPRAQSCPGPLARRHPRSRWTQRR